MFRSNLFKKLHTEKKEGGKNIQMKLVEYFEDLASKAQCEVLDADAYAVVSEMMHRESMGKNIPELDANELQHFLLQLRQIVEEIERWSEGESYEAEKEAEYARALFEIAKSNPELIRITNYLGLLLCHWELLKDWYVTYRLLADLVKMERHWSATEEDGKQLECFMNETE